MHSPPGAALKKAASSKISKYELSRREEATFDPLAVESYGAMGTHVKEWVDKVVGEALEFGSFLCLSQSSSSLREQFNDEISVALQKGNTWITVKASQICRTARRSPPQTAHDKALNFSPLETEIYAPPTPHH